MYEYLLCIYEYEYFILEKSKNLLLCKKKPNSSKKEFLQMRCLQCSLINFVKIHFFINITNALLYIDFFAKVEDIEIKSNYITSLTSKF
jgi:hypothetical protein